MFTLEPVSLTEILASAWTQAPPGREAAEQNAVLRALWEGLRRTHSRPPMRWHRPS